MNKAFYLGQAFKDTCSKGSSGHVHSVFSHAINIRTDKGELRTILSEKGDIMTTAALINCEHLKNFANLGDEILFTPQMIYVNHLPKIHIGPKTEIWFLHISSSNSVPTPKRMMDNCQKLATFLVEKATYNPDFLWNLAEKQEISSLIGLGIGLTPSGDDFICGMLMAFTYLERAYGWKYEEYGNFSLQVNENLYKTNDISRHFLKCALEGNIGKSSLRLLMAVCQDDERELIGAFEEKVKYGASSGMDEVAGVIYGVRLVLG